MQKNGKVITKISRLGLGKNLLGPFVMVLIVLMFGVAPAATAAEMDQEAKGILMGMAKYLANASAFSVTLRSSYDAIQENGQYIEFGEQRRILVQRPDRLRVESVRSDGEQTLVLFDGKEITAFKADDNVYTQVEKPGTVDEILVYLVRDLQFTLPLARMIHSGFAQQMEAMTLTSISYVEENTLFDVVTDHLAIRAEDIDMQLWIAQGKQPLPRRVTLTYKNAPGQPHFRGDFIGWSLEPEVAADSFVFTPPEGAEQIPFVARVQQKGSLPAQKGAEK